MTVKELILHKEVNTMTLREYERLIPPGVRQRRREPVFRLTPKGEHFVEEIDEQTDTILSIARDHEVSPAEIEIKTGIPRHVALSILSKLDDWGYVELVAQ